MKNPLMEYNKLLQFLRSSSSPLPSSSQLLSSSSSSSTTATTTTSVVIYNNNNNIINNNNNNQQALNSRDSSSTGTSINIDFNAKRLERPNKLQPVAMNSTIRSLLQEFYRDYNNELDRLLLQPR
jgi:hypothetical protein